MIVSDVITRVRNVSGDLNSLQFTDATVFNWINDGIRECAVQNNLLQKRATSSTIVGTPDYNLPTDILKLHSVKFDEQRLQVLTLQEFEEQYGSSTMVTTNGTPVVCYVWADKLTLYPKPSAVKSLVIDYIYDPALITAGANALPLPVGYHSRLVDYCLAQVAQQDDDLNRYSVKMQEFKTGVPLVVTIVLEPYCSSNSCKVSTCNRCSSNLTLWSLRISVGRLQSGVPTIVLLVARFCNKLF